MIVRSALMYKWTLYGLAAALCMAVQGMVLHRFHLWGVIPFLYPLLASIPASFEDPFHGTSLSLGLGVVCDLILPDRLPCFYTLTFPLTGLASSLLGRELLPGYLCSYAVSALAFLMNGFFHCLFSGFPYWTAGAELSARECLVTVPFFAPILTALFRAVAERTRYEEQRKG